MPLIGQGRNVSPRIRDNVLGNAGAFTVDSKVKYFDSNGEPTFDGPHILTIANKKVLGSPIQRRQRRP